jgi:hypothetical protein
MPPGPALAAFRHALTRDAVLAVSSAERAAVTGRAAAALDREAAPDARAWRVWPRGKRTG